MSNLLIESIIQNCLNLILG